MTKVLVLFAVLFFLPGVASLQAADDTKQTVPAVRFDPIVKNIEGWNVHVEPALLDDKVASEVGGRALRMLADHLNRIKIMVPKDRLKDLMKIEIWIEHKHPSLGAMQYHPGVGWLKKNGHDPRLVKKVHITHADALLSKGQMFKHPWVVLHELAHGYHDQFLSFEHPKVLQAYNDAKEKGSYEKVLLFTGKEVRHYGMNNHKEYFAEGTEAWFGRNDFYPFVRAELKEHDPGFYEVLEEIGGSEVAFRGWRF